MGQQEASSGDAGGHDALSEGHGGLQLDEGDVVAMEITNKDHSSLDSGQK